MEPEPPPPPLRPSIGEKDPTHPLDPGATASIPPSAPSRKSSSRIEKLAELSGQPRIGEYLLEQELGRGGMAVVYRARHRVTGQAFALKVILSQELGGEARPEQIERFLAEASARRASSTPTSCRSTTWARTTDSPTW